jgi:Tol biopolymer transport system component/DNA-binding winged helix-turn-helix (wHTH) protein
MKNFMPPAVNNLFEFGEFRLNPKEKMLLRRNQTVPLTPKVFELLALFVENHGQLIEKDEIMQRLWADSFVEESNLTFTVRQLRKVLDDNAQNPTYIETVWGHGYRFIAKVIEVRGKNPPFAEETLPLIGNEFETLENTPNLPVKFAEKDNPKSVFVAYLPVTALVAFLIISLAAAFIWSKNWISSQTNAPILNAEFKSEQLTNAGGVYEAAISPDGKLMAYLNEIGGKTGIWLKQLDTGENTEIVPNTDDSFYGLDFSRDGQELYFSRGPKVDEGRKINIYRVSILGGIPKEVIGDVEGLFSFSPDNRQISFIRCPRRDNDFCSLFVADVDGKNENKLLTRPRPIRMRDNQFSPDGKSIAIAVGQSRTSSSEFGLVEVNIETKAEREITNHKFSNIHYLRWLPDQSGILLTAYEPPNNSVKIYQVSAQTNEVKLLSKDSISYDGISLDKAAKKLITTQITANFRLWSAPFNEPDKAKPISQSAPSMYMGQRLCSFTSDGNIVFVSGSDSNQHIWIMTGDGSNQRQLTSGEGTNWQPRISPDQKYVFFASNRTGSAQIWRMKIDGSNQTQISEGKEGNRPIFVAGDGKTIYFESPKDSNLGKLTIADDEKTSSSLISSERTFQPEVNPAGDTVVYFSRGKTQYFQISLMSLADGQIIKSFPLGNEKAFPAKIIWSNDGKSLFVLSRTEKSFVVWKYSIETGEGEMFADLGEERVSDFALSPDGKSFIYVRGKELNDAFLITGLK